MAVLAVLHAACIDGLSVGCGLLDLRVERSASKSITASASGTTGGRGGCCLDRWSWGRIVVIYDFGALTLWALFIPLGEPCSGWLPLFDALANELPAIRSAI